MTSRRGDNDDALSFGSPLRDELPRRRYYRSFNDRSTPRIECAVYPLVHTSFNYVEGGGGLLFRGTILGFGSPTFF